jgi:hypothetical protein
MPFHVRFTITPALCPALDLLSAYDVILLLVLGRLLVLILDGGVAHR